MNSISTPERQCLQGDRPSHRVADATLSIWRGIAEQETGRQYHATLVERAIAQALGHLADWSDVIRQDGPTAIDGGWIWTRTVGGRDYAAIRHEQPIFCGNKTKSLGHVGSADHRDMERRIKRRDALADIERTALNIQSIAEALLHVVDPGIETSLVSIRKKPRQERVEEALRAIAALSPEERRIVLAAMAEEVAA